MVGDYKKKKSKEIKNDIFIVWECGNTISYHICVIDRIQEA